MTLTGTHPIAASACICTYNGAARIGAVIKALAAQTLSTDSWELLVIDNASMDDTSAIAERMLAQAFSGSGRVVREAHPGLSFARVRAVQEAKAQVLCFLDDDNLPNPDYIEKAIAAFKTKPKAGVIGGKVLAQWEAKPTALAEKVAPFALAICDHGDAPQLIDGTGAGIVGAGMCVRRKALEEAYGSKLCAGSVTGRKGTNLISGEDTALCVAARQMDYECWYEPSLVIRHLLPARRMEKDYLVRLYEGIGRGQAAVRRLYDWKVRNPLAALVAAKDYSRWLRKGLASPQHASNSMSPELANDLRDLDRRLIWARARETLAFWR